MLIRVCIRVCAVCEFMNENQLGKSNFYEMIEFETKLFENNV